MVATQLLDVAHVLGVQRAAGPVGVARKLAPLAAGVLERERLAQVLLRLDVVLHELEVQRAQVTHGLAQDRDDARARLQLGDARGGGARPQVHRRCLPRELPRLRAFEQPHVVLEARRRFGLLARSRDIMPA